MMHLVIVATTTDENIRTAGTSAMTATKQNARIISSVVMYAFAMNDAIAIMMASDSGGPVKILLLFP